MRGGNAADEHIAKPPELLEQDRIIWNDLPPEKLGPIAVSDEVLQLHQCASLRPHTLVA
jgi:hypothetical protein